MNHDAQSAQFLQKQDGQMLHSDKKKQIKNTKLLRRIFVFF